MKISTLIHWGCIGCQGFQLLGFLTEITPSLQTTTIPLLTITLLLVTISAYIDFSKMKNNKLDPNPIYILAPHVSAAVAILGMTLLGGYLGSN